MCRLPPESGERLRHWQNCHICQGRDHGLGVCGIATHLALLEELAERERRYAAEVLAASGGLFGVSSPAARDEHYAKVTAKGLREILERDEVRPDAVVFDSEGGFHCEP